MEEARTGKSVAEKVPGQVPRKPVARRRKVGNLGIEEKRNCVCGELFDILMRCDNVAPLDKPLNVMPNPENLPIIDPSMDLVAIRVQLIAKRICICKAMLDILMRSHNSSFFGTPVNTAVNNPGTVDSLKDATTIQNSEIVSSDRSNNVPECREFIMSNKSGDVASSPHEDSSSSSEFSDWTAEDGVSLQPPKRARKARYKRPQYPSINEGADANTAIKTNEDKGIGCNLPLDSTKKTVVPRKQKLSESFRPSEWLSEVVPRRTPYYPQMGDEIVYFRQGHELYVRAVNKKKEYEISPQLLPWSHQNIREQELVKVIGIKYEIKPPRLCYLKLGFIDPVTEALTGKSFTITYHDMEDVTDFLVLRQMYELAFQRDWKVGDHFRSIVNDLWWEGQLVEQKPYQFEHPNSMFLYYRVRWGTNEFDQMSPWEFEPLDPRRRSVEPGAGIPVLPEEMIKMSYQPKAEDWPPDGNRDVECDRIAAAILQVMGLAVAEPFLVPVDLNVHPNYAFVVEYPIDLSTIKARLENRFYRRMTAVQYDVRYIYINACKFNQDGSDVIRHASIITDLCMEIIRNRKMKDVTAAYHQLVNDYRKSLDKNGPGPSAPQNPKGKKKSPPLDIKVPQMIFTKEIGK